MKNFRIFVILLLLTTASAMSSDKALQAAMVQFNIPFFTIVVSILTQNVAMLFYYVAYGSEGMFTSTVWVSVCTYILVVWVRKIPRRNLAAKIFRPRWWRRMCCCCIGKRCDAVDNQQKAVLIECDHFGNDVLNGKKLDKNSILYRLFVNLETKFETLVLNENVISVYRRLVNEFVSMRAWLICTDESLWSRPSYDHEAQGAWNGLTGLIKFDMPGRDYWNNVIKRADHISNLLHRIKAPMNRRREFNNILLKYTQIRRPTIADLRVLQRLIMIDIVLHKSINGSDVVVSGGRNINNWLDADNQNQFDDQNIPMDQWNKKQIVTWDCAEFGEMEQRSDGVMETDLNVNWRDLTNQNYVERGANQMYNYENHHSQNYLMLFETNEMVEYQRIEREERYYYVIKHGNGVVQLMGGQGKFERGVQYMEECHVSVQDVKEQEKLKHLNLSGAKLIFKDVEHNEHAYSHALSKIKHTELINKNVGKTMMEIAASMTGIVYTRGLHFLVAMMTAHDMARREHVLHRMETLARNQYVSIVFGSIGKVNAVRLRLHKCIIHNAIYDIIPTWIHNFMYLSKIKMIETMTNFDCRIFVSPFVYNNDAKEQWLLRFNWWPSLSANFISMWRVEAKFKGQTEVYTHELVNLLQWFLVLLYKSMTTMVSHDIVDYNGGYVHMNVVIRERTEVVETRSNVNTQLNNDVILWRVTHSDLGLFYNYHMTFIPLDIYESIQSWTFGAQEQRNNIVLQKLNDQDCEQATHELRELLKEKKKPTELIYELGEWVEHNKDGFGRDEFDNELFRMVDLPIVEREIVEFDDLPLINNIIMTNAFSPIDDDEIVELEPATYTLRQLRMKYGIENADDAVVGEQLTRHLTARSSVVFELCGRYYTTPHLNEKTDYYNILMRGDDLSFMTKRVKRSEVQLDLRIVQEPALTWYYFVNATSLSDQNCVPTFLENINLRVKNRYRGKTVYTLRSLFEVFLDQDYEVELDQREIDLRDKVHLHKRVTGDENYNYLAQNAAFVQQEEANYVAEATRHRTMMLHTNAAQGLNVRQTNERMELIANPMEHKGKWRDSRVSRHQQETTERYQIVGKTVQEMTTYERMKIVPPGEMIDLSVLYSNQHYFTDVGGAGNNDKYWVWIFDGHLYLVQTTDVNTANTTQMDQNNIDQLPYTTIRGIDNDSAVNTPQQCDQHHEATVGEDNFLNLEKSKQYMLKWDGHEWRSTEFDDQEWFHEYLKQPEFADFIEFLAENLIQERDKAKREKRNVEERNKNGETQNVECEATKILNGDADNKGDEKIDLEIKRDDEEKEKVRSNTEGKWIEVVEKRKNKNKNKKKKRSTNKKKTMKRMRLESDVNDSPKLETKEETKMESTRSEEEINQFEASGEQEQVVDERKSVSKEKKMDESEMQCCVKKRAQQLMHDVDFRDSAIRLMNRLKKRLERVNAAKMIKIVESNRRKRRYKQVKFNQTMTAALELLLVYYSEKKEFKCQENTVTALLQGDAAVLEWFICYSKARIVVGHRLQDKSVLVSRNDLDVLEGVGIYFY